MARVTFRPTADFEEFIPPHATTIGEILADDIPLCSFVGDGAERHSDEIRGAGFPVLPPPIGMPSAEGLWTSSVDRGPSLQSQT